MESEVKVIPEQKLGVINCKTPIEDLEIFLSILMGWVDAEEIETEGEPFIVYFSPRHEVNEGDAVYDVSIAIKQDADETDRIRVVDMIEHKVLSGKHFGPTDNILDTYAELVDKYGVPGLDANTIILGRYCTWYEGCDTYAEAEEKVVKNLCKVIRTGNLKVEELICCILALGCICDQRQQETEMRFKHSTLLRGYK